MRASLKHVGPKKKDFFCFVEFRPIVTSLKQPHQTTATVTEDQILPACSPSPSLESRRFNGLEVSSPCWIEGTFSVYVGTCEENTGVL